MLGFSPESTASLSFTQFQLLLDKLKGQLAGTSTRRGGETSGEQYDWYALERALVTQLPQGTPIDTFRGPVVAYNLDDIVAVLPPVLRRLVSTKLKSVAMTDADIREKMQIAVEERRRRRSIGVVENKKFSIISTLVRQFLAIW